MFLVMSGQIAFVIISFISATRKLTFKLIRNGLGLFWSFYVLNPYVLSSLSAQVLKIEDCYFICRQYISFLTRRNFYSCG